jgi:acetyltransferase-like isoleucine patch superfamily enzyme
MCGVSIGENCNIGDNTFMESGVAVGSNVTIKNGNMLWEGITLEDGVFVGPGVFFTNDRHPRSPRLPEASHRYQDHGWLSPTLVKQGAAIGAGSVILPGIIIGEYATIGAGAVVTKDVRPYAVVAGNPARQKGWVCRCGLPLTFVEECSQCVCGRKYFLQNEMVQLK